MRSLKAFGIFLIATFLPVFVSSADLRRGGGRIQGSGGRVVAGEPMRRKRTQRRRKPAGKRGAVSLHADEQTPSVEGLPPFQSTESAGTCCRPQTSSPRSATERSLEKRGGGRAAPRCGTGARATGAQYAASRLTRPCRDRRRPDEVLARCGAHGRRIQKCFSSAGSATTAQEAGAAAKFCSEEIASPSPPIVGRFREMIHSVQWVHSESVESL